jgi:hypothetical protein
MCSDYCEGQRQEGGSCYPGRIQAAEPELNSLIGKLWMQPTGTEYGAISRYGAPAEIAID